MAICKGSHNPILRGLTNHGPWLLTTYPSPGMILQVGPTTSTNSTSRARFTPRNRTLSEVRDGPGQQIQLHRNRGWVANLGICLRTVIFLRIVLYLVGESPFFTTVWENILYVFQSWANPFNGNITFFDWIDILTLPEHCLNMESNLPSINFWRTILVE